jgi:single-stranded-DNA-specific exonuclease
MEHPRHALLSADHVVPHTDADGLAAGALALRARGQPATAAVLLAPQQTPWGPDPDLPPGSIALLDWGVRAFARPGVLIDHHVPEERPVGAVVVSSHGEEPETPSAPLVRRQLPEQPAWLAAVGAAGDLGRPGLNLPECAGAPRTAVMRLVPFVNAPRRIYGGPVRTALALLMESREPAAALRDPRIAQLDAARRAWRASFERAIRTPPLVRDNVALLRFDEPCQVHPLVAQASSRRLAPRIVISANEGWIPGRVNFAVRGGGGADLRTVLREAAPDLASRLGFGHRAATGGSLTPQEFQSLLHALGLTRAH